MTLHDIISSAPTAPSNSIHGTAEGKLTRTSKMKSRLTGLGNYKLKDHGELSAEQVAAIHQKSVMLRERMERITDQINHLDVYTHGLLVRMSTSLQMVWAEDKGEK